MTEQDKIAKKIKTQGYAIVKHDMDNESPDEWFIFGIWFFLKQDFIIDLDWQKGKYYMYLDSAKEIVYEKQLRSKYLDRYSAEEFLKGNVLKHYTLFCDISEQIRNNGFYTTEDKKTIGIIKRGDNKYVLAWIIEEWAGCDSVYCIFNKELPLMMLSTFDSRDTLFEEAVRRGFELKRVRPCQIDDNEEFEEEDMETQVIGFKQIEFYC